MTGTTAHASGTLKAVARVTFGATVALIILAVIFAALGAIRLVPTLMIIVALVSAVVSVTTRGISRQTDPAPQRAASGNDPARPLQLVSVGALVVGIVMAVWGGVASGNARRGNDLLVAIGGYGYYDPHAGDAGAAWMWVGIVLAAVGMIGVIALLAIRAVGTRDRSDAGPS